MTTKHARGDYKYHSTACMTTKNCTCNLQRFKDHCTHAPLPRYYYLLVVATKRSVCYRAADDALP